MDSINSITYSYDSEFIVQQLTCLLNFIDEHLRYNLYYNALVSELSLCLIYRSNNTLLPYIFVLERYGNDAEVCSKHFVEIYCRNNIKKQSDQMTETS
jgi:hypothetical protein